MSSFDRSRVPPIGPTRDYAFPEVVSTTLPNGLAVRTIEHRELPVVTCVLLMPVGSAHDPTERPGLAAVAADMLDESSGGRSALEVHEALDDIGAQCDVEIGCDATILGLTTLSRHCQRGLHLLADMVVRPGFESADFARVRELRLHRLLQMRDQAGAIADRMFVRLVYGDHPYGHLSLGTEAALELVTKDEIEAFHLERYVPNRATLIVVGDASHDDLARHAGEAFTTWSGVEESESSQLEPDLTISSHAPSDSSGLFVADRPGAAQSELRIGHLGVSRATPDFHALLVLNSVLGGQFVSRINSNLREDKGYTYGARSAFDFRRARGTFVVQTSVASDATANAIAEIRRELRDVRGDRPPTDDELALAKAALTRGFPRGFETTEQVARAFTVVVLHGLPDDYFTCFGPAVNAVTSIQVRQAAEARLSPAQATFAVVGDRKEVAPSLRALGLGEPQEMPVA